MTDLMNAVPSSTSKQSPGELPPIDGVRLAVAEARICYEDRPDLLLVLLDEGTRVAGLFTQSFCRAAPVDWCQERVRAGLARALIVNAGNANAATGWQGEEAVAATSKGVASVVGCQPQDVFVASTGVIGVPLDVSRYSHLFGDMVAKAAPDSWQDAARAIMTTDTYPKLAARRVEMGGQMVTINGIAKGAGMIAPNMATTLSFLFTDAPIDAKPLQAVFARGIDKTFNAISVDGDTSTNDTSLLFATGAAEKRGMPRIFSEDDARLAKFEATLADLLQELAFQVIRDGEGASKMIAVSVEGAVSDLSARRVAFSIANSLLVKTAVAGESAQWGRVIMAIGKAGESVDKNRLEIQFGPHRVACEGQRDPNCDEAELATYMRARDIEIFVNLHDGSGKSTVWTSDLTHEYVSLNV